MGRPLHKDIALKEQETNNTFLRIDMENSPINWSPLFRYRDNIHRTYRAVWDIPLIKKRSALFKKILKDGMSILDAGAGMRGMEADIAKAGITVTYKSMDIDKTNHHDYYDLADIKDEQFDVVVSFEVIEHMGLEEGLVFLTRLRELTKDGGLIILSTPNIFNPGRFMRDATHKTFYCYDELCGLLNMAGFEIRDVYRSYNDAFHRYLLKAYILKFLFRFLGIDYAHSIFVVGERKGGPKP
jgi:2-polyprenyl-3-methyl-5-hydroxy-6-metoxy-1,4-benzoquinol methylase